MHKRVGNWTGKHTRQITKEEMKIYGEKFKQMRESVNLNLEEMSKELGFVSRFTLSRWEKGLTVPQLNIHEIEEDIEYIVRHYKNKAS